MVIKEIEVKDIMTKTNLPVSDFAVNPYVGCTHACKYCYASFMKRFTIILSRTGLNNTDRMMHDIALALLPQTPTTEVQGTFLY